MRRLLSPSVIDIPVGGGRRSPLPPPLFRLLSPLPDHGAGALPQFRPSPLFRR